jgi:hypothetical protein
MRFRLFAMIAFCVSPMTLAAAEKEEACRLQADVVAAVQQARLDRVKQDKVIDTVFEANPDWPAAMRDAMPPTVDWVYSMKRRDLRKVELGPVAETQCLDNWDAVQALTKN